MARARRVGEAHFEVLGGEVDAPGDLELHGAPGEIDVGVAAVDTHLAVGGIGEPALDAVPRRLDHLHLHRRRLGVRRIGIDRRLDAGEIARALQPAHVLIESLDAVRLGGLERAEVAHQRRIVLLDSVDLDRAEAEERAAFQLHVELRAGFLGKDPRLAFVDACGGVGTGGEGGDGAILGAIPFLLAKALPLVERPLGAHGGDRLLAGTVVGRRRSGDADVDAADVRRFAGHDLHPYHASCVLARRRLERHVDLGREVPFRRGRFDGLVVRFLHELLQHDRRGALVILPAHDVEAVAQRLLECARRVDHHAIADRRAARIGRVLRADESAGHDEREGDADARARERRRVSRASPRCGDIHGPPGRSVARVHGAPEVPMQDAGIGKIFLPSVFDAHHHAIRRTVRARGMRLEARSARVGCKFPATRRATERRGARAAPGSGTWIAFARRHRRTEPQDRGGHAASVPSADPLSNPSAGSRVGPTVDVASLDMRREGLRPEKTARRGERSYAGAEENA